MRTPYIVALASDGGWFAAFEREDHAPVWKYSFPDKEKNNIQVWTEIDEQCMTHFIKFLARSHNSLRGLKDSGKGCFPNVNGLAVQESYC